MRNAMSLSRLHPLVLIAVLLGPGSVASAQSPRPSRDEGLLDPAWFSTEELDFREGGRLDYLWVRSGFTVEGRTLQFMQWTETVLPSNRDAKDRATAEKLKAEFPPALAEAFATQLAGKAKVVPADGSLLVFGRIVDCNAGAMYVWPNHTFEMKLIDADGALQVALHTRFVGKVNKMNMGAWAKTVAKPFAEGIEGAWRSGKPAAP